jgi:hypothetical protein
MKEEQCLKELMKGTRKLDPVLNPLGFVFKISENGVSSAGAFAAGFYENGDKKIGLIFRSFAGLGSVNYECRRWNIDHDSLMRYLGKQDVSKLKYKTNTFKSYSKDGGDVFDAFVYDIQQFGGEFLTSSDDQFENALKEIRETPQPKDKEASGSSQSIWVRLIWLAIILSIIIYLLQR